MGIAEAVADAVVAVRRIDPQISTRALASRLGVSAATVLRVLRGEIKPPGESVEFGSGPEAWCPVCEHYAPTPCPACGARAYRKRHPELVGEMLREIGKRLGPIRLNPQLGKARNRRWKTLQALRAAGVAEGREAVAVAEAIEAGANPGQLHLFVPDPPASEADDQDQDVDVDDGGRAA